MASVCAQLLSGCNNNDSNTKFSVLRSLRSVTASISQRLGVFYFVDRAKISQFNYKQVAKRAELQSAKSLMNTNRKAKD